jgi:hypothetical protein
VIAHLSFPAELLAEVPAESAPESGPARWLRTQRRSIVPSDDHEAADEAEAAVAVGPPRRGTPMRAEDVLGVGQRDGASVWWSRRGAPTAAVTAAASAAGGSTAGASGSTAAARPSGAETKTNGAGLPVRVPMAHLPRPQPADATVGRPPDEPDPLEVRGVLSRFYGGVRRAAAEDDNQRVT